MNLLEVLDNTTIIIRVRYRNNSDVLALWRVTCTFYTTWWPQDEAAGRRTAPSGSSLALLKPRVLKPPSPPVTLSPRFSLLWIRKKTLETVGGFKQATRACDGGQASASKCVRACVRHLSEERDVPFGLTERRGVSVPIASAVPSNHVHWKQFCFLRWGTALGQTSMSVGMPAVHNFFGASFVHLWRD